MIDWMAVMIAVFPAPNATPWMRRMTMRRTRLSAAMYASEARTKTAMEMTSRVRRPMKSRYLPVRMRAMTAPTMKPDEANPAAAWPAEKRATAYPAIDVMSR
ncbi:Uncharacterised protein [Mycobacteroides abscessus subsp. abscessus]|nr:Uncharacterised protein [Mycobacteroides abscessus subsp. abscessus]